ncbi:hypothetical protein EUGRSUZ_F01816 [Eucalyptus grandis]|uniref:Uncharacterized protein n=2 Tax=Eucalyptus grandis TaxID=71139 RepID=A0A059BQ38_EUCGR|nr:hypothetical protein EUGRSUZ_F01816 [Eucalyptus grandis]
MFTMKSYKSDWIWTQVQPAAHGHDRIGYPRRSNRSDFVKCPNRERFLQAKANLAITKHPNLLGLQCMLKVSGFKINLNSIQNLEYILSKSVL